MDRISTDVLVSGGGIAGLIAACAFGSAGFSVLVVDPAPPVIEPDNPSADMRSTAFLQPARNTLISAGIWDKLEPHAAALQVMRLADAGGEPGVIRTQADFDASEISDLPFGWNFPNWLIRRELLNRIDEPPEVTFKAGVSTKRLTHRLNENLVNLSDGSQVAARLVVGADGRNSSVRDALDIGVKTWRYGQKALVFSVSHPAPHDNISTEIHRSGGPFTLVPLPDRDGAHYSAIVWMETGANIARLHALDDGAFAQELNLRSCNVLGTLTVASPKHVWPIIAQKADKLIGPRTALIAEAAHVVPPIGAQGLNMSLADIEVLVSLVKDSPDGDPGGQSLLDRYQSKRSPDIAARLQGVNLLNKASITDNPNLQDLRYKGLQTLFGLKPLRMTAMKAGLGSR